MTPKAQQITNYEVTDEHNNNNINLADKKAGGGGGQHRRSLSSNSEIFFNTTTANHNQAPSSASLLLYNITNRLSSVFSPAVILMIATPIAMQYPLLQLIMFITIIVGTSPLYFIMITFVSKSHSKQHNKPIKPQPHRRQPSIVGSISEMEHESKTTSR